MVLVHKNIAIVGPFLLNAQWQCHHVLGTIANTWPCIDEYAIEKWFATANLLMAAASIQDSAKMNAALIMCQHAVDATP